MRRKASVVVRGVLAVCGGVMGMSGAAWGGGSSDVVPNPAMLRFPDVSADRICFVYADDIWLVGREGGEARPIASPAGQELFPRFSPDGQRLAFVGNYDGDRDVYVVGVEGGVPVRVTHHPANEVLCDWTPDGKLLYVSNGTAGLARITELFVVGPEGGMAERVGVPYGENGALSDDGSWLAYTPFGTDFRTWKRYRGGMNSDVWLFNLKTGASKHMTTWEGTDSSPMWHGDKVYYVTDEGPEHRQNIWVYDTKTEKRSQVTTFSEHDVKFPSIGPGADGGGEVVFQCGSGLYLLDLRTGKSAEVKVTMPGARPELRDRLVDGSKFVTGWTASATGKRVVMEARGDVWTVPVENGSPRNLTRTSGVAERYPSWSPDGKWIAYMSDESGEYELYRRKADGSGEAERLTNGHQTYFFNPTWSSDSKRLVFSDKAGNLLVCDVESGATKTIDTDPWAGRAMVSWSHDGAWLAYTKGGENNQNELWMWEAATGTTTRVTSGFFSVTWPAFDRKGEYLYLACNSEFSEPVYEDLGSTFAYVSTDRLMVVPLREDVKSPLAAKSDEEGMEEEKKDDEKKKDEVKKEDGEAEDEDEGDDEDEVGEENDEEDEKDEDEKKEEPKAAIKIDLEGFEARMVRLPVDRGGFTHVSVNSDGHVVYVRQARPGSGGKPAVKVFDGSADKKEEKQVIGEVGAFSMSADGKWIVVWSGGGMARIAPKADQKIEKTISLAGMDMMVNPREEWAQIFKDAWRRHRDFFYDPTMHGVDWAAVGARYEKMLADCATRNDVSYVISEMISELNVGHAYYWGGDVEAQPNVGVGLLGCDFALENGAYRITKILGGAAWDADARSPLATPGLGVKAGDYLLAVNGAPVDVKKDPWASFLNMADRTITITVSESPTMDEKARTVAVKTIGDETYLRYRDWVERNRAFVAEATSGKVGYIYVPNTGVDGQNELFRQFYAQRHKEALIIDERWNGGGQIPTRFVELLNRPTTNRWAVRDGNDWNWPPDSHQGPKCMLINGRAGSGGDAFPYYFKQAGLGKLIGRRTWGGLVGITGMPGLIDGGYTAVPTFAFYENDGTWGIEGHGVDPDIEVMDDPALMVDGGDPQLDAAIREMMAAIEKNPPRPAKRPAYPDRSGMGLPDRDK